jgi:hypothetical protein
MVVHVIQTVTINHRLSAVYVILAIQVYIAKLTLLNVNRIHVKITVFVMNDRELNHSIQVCNIMLFMCIL